MFCSRIYYKNKQKNHHIAFKLFLVVMNLIQSYLYDTTKLEFIKNIYVYQLPKSIKQLQIQNFWITFSFLKTYWMSGNVKLHQDFQKHFPPILKQAQYILNPVWCGMGYHINFLYIICGGS